MKRPRPRRLGACIILFLLSDASFGATAVSWSSLPALFRQRFAQRAPERGDLETAALNQQIGGGFHLDPVVAADYQRSRADDGTGTKRLTTSVTQSSPYGTSLSVSRTETSGDTTADPTVAAVLPSKTTSVTLSQKLLKNGPFKGPAEGRAADVARALAELKAAERFDELLLAAQTAFVSVEEADLVLTAAKRAQAIALEQSKAVEDLVSSGYKPKADLLVSDQATVRAELQVMTATQKAEQARRDLAKALFQEPGDEPLAVTAQDGDDAVEKRLAPLKAVAWDAAPPKLREAQLNLEAARLAEDIARRDDWPSLAVSATASRASAETGPGFPNRRYDDRTYGMQLNVPLVGAIRRDHAALAGLARQKAEGDAATAARTLDDAHRALDEKKALAERQLATAEKLAELAAKTLTIEQQKYADGKSTIAEVRRLQEESDAAAQSVLNARKNLLLQYLEFARTVGALGRLYP
jgi:outer membrane protein TolC